MKQTKPNKQNYFIEMTDTFGGESNYSWVNRFLVRSVSMRGAISKVARETGYYARLTYECGDMARYDATSACICYFVTEATGQETEIYSRVVTL